MTPKANGKTWDKETLLKFFDMLGLDFKCMMQYKEGRSRIQDIVYLATASGIDTGYKFVWYSGNRGA